MPTHVCSICRKTEFYSTRVATLHTCQVCHRPFCKQCAATFFLCSQCEPDLPAGIIDDLEAALRQPRKTMEITLWTTGIGIILLPTTLIAVAIISATRAYPLIFLPIIQALSGVMILISSAGVRYSSRITMRQEAHKILQPFSRGFYHGRYYGAQPGWQPQTWQPAQPMYQPAQPAAFPPARPAIPSSAFLPQVNEIPYVPPGTRAVPASIDVPVAAAATQEHGAPGKTGSYCGACGAAMPDLPGLKFCPDCGAPRE
ncbi:MAG: hypothetical protein Q6373_013835 [Candidatus Sigynarchaeota archaeon]